MMVTLNLQINFEVNPIHTFEDEDIWILLTEDADEDKDERWVIQIVH